MIRKFVIGAATVAVLSIPAFAQESANSDQGEGAIGWTAAQIGLFAPISYPWGNEWDVCGADLNLLYAVNARLQGVSAAFGATRTTDDMKGVEFSFFCNWNAKDVAGVRASLFGLNYAGGNVSGIDWGFFGYRRGWMKGVDVNFIGSHQRDFTGLQLAGICNFTAENFVGIEGTLGLSFARELKGAQIGGINFAQRFRGCQIGLFNIAEECPNGLQIGLVNIIMDNTLKVLPLVNFYFE